MTFRFAPSLLMCLSIGATSCLGISSNVDRERHFRKGYGYVTFLNNLDSPTGRPANFKLNQFISMAIDSKGRYFMVSRDRNPTGNFEFTVTRYLASGSLDTTFGGGNGWIAPNGGLPSLVGASPANNKDESPLYSISWDSQNRSYISIISGDAGGPFASTVVRLTEAGEIDTSFGTGGFFTTSTPGTTLAGGTVELVGAVYVPSLDRFLAFGQSSNVGMEPELATARYTTTGVLDAAYGASGGYSVFQNNGNSTTGGPNGGPKSDWGVDNHVTDSSGNYYFSVSQAFDFNGAVGGYTGSVAKVTSAGIFDVTYGPYGTGIAEFPAKGAAGLTGTAFGLKDDSLAEGRIAIDPSGRTYVSGRSFDPNGATQSFVARWTTAGMLDTSFGTGGIAFFNNGGISVAGYGTALNKYETLNHVAYDSTLSKIVATGTTGNGASGRPLVVRFNLDGTLDTSFGSGAGYRVITPPDRPTEGFAGATTPSDACTQIIVDHLGRYIVGCLSKNALGGYEPVIIRLNADGSTNI